MDFELDSMSRPVSPGSSRSRRCAVRAILAVVLAAGGIAAPESAGAFWRGLRLIGAGEAGYVGFGDLANFVAYLQTGGSPGEIDEPLPIRYTLADETAVGFRLGLELYPRLEILWSRLGVSTRARVFANGVELESNPDAVPRVVIPDMDVRFDTISVAYRFDQLTLWNIAPLARVGFGWILTSQKEDLVLPGRLPVDYSDSDKGWEISAGLVWRWRWLQAGGAFRTFHWRWDTEDQFIPARTARAWMASGWVGVRL